MKLLSNYKKLLDSIDENVDGVEQSSEQRCVVAGTLFDVCLDYAKGIQVLFQNSLDASAFTLTRSLFETFVRGAWIRHCATQTEIDVFIAKDKIIRDTKESFTFGDMIDAIEASTGWPPHLSEIKARCWTALNSYTHGGMFQVTRRYDGATIEPHHDAAQVDEVIQFSCIIVLKTIAEIAEMSGNPKLADFVLKVSEETVSWCFDNTIQPSIKTLAD